MRHYFYQWKLAAVMSWAFAVVVDKFVYLPKVLAMGYRDACVLAQAMSWVIVFRKPRPSAGDDPWPEEAEYCLPAGASSSASMPPFLWLRAVDGERVGAIFVLLDGVFILTRDAALRHRWRRRIERNLLQLRVQAKPCECASAHVSIEQQTLLSLAWNSGWARVSRAIWGE